MARRARKSKKLGGGGRFEALEKKLEGKKGVKDAKAIAASIGRKKYGKNAMGKMAAKGRKRASRKG